jgi:hypothetical protein
MAAWLALHGLDAGRCRRILERAAKHRPARVEPRALRRPVTLSAEETWNHSAAAFARAFPDSTAAVAEVARTARTDFRPPAPARSRPFTLHDGGDGRPWVFCPFTGTAADALAIAHEFGHALQTVLARGAFLPPMLREAAAIQAERIALAGFEELKHPDAPLLAAAFAAASRRTFAVPLARLEAALDRPSEPYSYAWNYPPARVLALESGLSLRKEALWRLAAGAQGLPELCDHLAI